MSRQNTFFGKPGSGSGIVQPIDWRLGAQAGQSIGGALAQMGAQGGEVMKTKAVQKNLGDKARKALKLFKDDLELDDSDIDAYSRAEAEGVLAGLPMMFKRSAEQDTADYRDRHLDISQQQTDAMAALRGAQSGALKAEEERQGKFTQALQTQIADAHDVVKNKNYFLSQKGKKKGDWDKQATDEQKAAVKFFNSPAVQMAFKGTEWTPDQWEKMDLDDRGVELNTVRDPDTGATVFTFGNQMRVVESPGAGARTGSEADVAMTDAAIKRGDFGRARVLMTSGQPSSYSVGGPDRNVLHKINPGAVSKDDKLRMAEIAMSQLPSQQQKEFVRAYWVLAGNEDEEGMNREQATGIMQVIGDYLPSLKEGDDPDKTRKEWFDAMVVHDKFR